MGKQVWLWKSVWKSKECRRGGEQLVSLTPFCSDSSSSTVKRRASIWLFPLNRIPSYVRLSSPTRTSFSAAWRCTPMNSRSTKTPRASWSHPNFISPIAYLQWENRRTATDQLSSLQDSMLSSVLTNSSSSIITTTSAGHTRMVGYENFDPVLCLTISGKQDIRLKLKQSEQIFGPKVNSSSTSLWASFSLRSGGNRSALWFDELSPNTETTEISQSAVHCLSESRSELSLSLRWSVHASLPRLALHSTSQTTLYNNASANNRPMTDEDFRRIEQNLAEEIRRKNCQVGAQQYDPDYFHYADLENPAGKTSSGQHSRERWRRCFQIRVNRCSVRSKVACPPVLTWNRPTPVVDLIPARCQVRRFAFLHGTANRSFRPTSNVATPSFVFCSAERGEGPSERSDQAKERGLSTPRRESSLFQKRCDAFWSKAKRSSARNVASSSTLFPCVYSIEIFRAVRPRYASSPTPTSRTSPRSTHRACSTSDRSTSIDWNTPKPVPRIISRKCEELPGSSGSSFSS